MTLTGLQLPFVPGGTVRDYRLNLQKFFIVVAADDRKTESFVRFHQGRMDTFSDKFVGIRRKKCILRYSCAKIQAILTLNLYTELKAVRH